VNASSNNDVVQLDSRRYHTLRARLCFTPCVAINLAILAGDLGLLGLVYALLQAGNWAAYGAAQVLLVLVFFHHFSILHDCGHRSCADKHWVNTLIGHYASVFCFMPFFPWQHVHNQHHCWVGNIDRDPTLKLVRDYEASARVKNAVFRWAWRLWIPVLALNQHLVLWSYPLVMWREGKVRWRVFFRCLVSIVVPLIAYAAFALLLPELVTFANFAPAVIIYLLAVELVNFPHHIGTEYLDAESGETKLPVWQQSRVTRSCYYPKALAELLVLNFNFHTEHHLFPALPWYRLRQARDLIRPALGEKYRESQGLSWSLENRRRDAAAVFCGTSDETIHK
jgi:omega-6 fatty acid desaturase (delta-12 desaturase)